MLYFVPTPIGNLSDISQHSLEIISSCEIVFCEDTRVTKSLINLLKTRYNLEIKDKIFYSLHSHNEESFLKNIDIEIFSKKCVYMSDAGMPCISDPGVGLVKFAQENGIEYEVISGANALLLAVAASGLVEKEFTFLAFLPNLGKERAIAIQNALNSPYPTVIYESPKRILSLVEDIAKLDENRKLFLIKEASKKFEKKFFETSLNLAKVLKDENLNGEWSVVVQKSPNSTVERINLKDIEELEIPPKQKAKLLSKLTGENSKEIYKKLTK
ncbi:16S rRNA (cytidine(1402)-2'-O)-methyltransferase [Campylobacter geochelonis]|uniref:16S rRNA (cytidine(1402)-2'-O)-methyltransferase n=1 Tax=Campylobacter geochelonis TaxID=1780362 RepID=UPI000770930D|nr:16S rRNA (cytidine(1402)-2'-O)-methyltransferase [Campylobacter geochelonis]CZE50396.1 tetrapyrrole methylase [Campylobacter geochelonis]